MASLTIDNELSEKAAKAFAKEGLSLKDAVDRFLRDRVKKDELTFEKDINCMYENDTSPFISAFRKAQKAFEGCAEKWGFNSEEDIVKYIKEVRRERYEQKQKEKNIA